LRQVQSDSCLSAKQSIAFFGLGRELDAQASGFVVMDLEASTAIAKPFG
jgi:hypothetical protein